MSQSEDDERRLLLEEDMKNNDDENSELNDQAASVSELNEQAASVSELNEHTASKLDENLASNLNEVLELNETPTSNSSTTLISTLNDFSPSELNDLSEQPTEGKVCMEENTEKSHTEEQILTMNKADLVCSLTDDTSEKSDDEGADGAEAMEMNVFTDHKDEKASLKDNDFEVEMNYTPDSDRVGLEGEYILHFSPEVLELLDTDEAEVVAKWNYRHLRRVGYNKIQNKFIIDAGRMCGEFKGVFDFSVNDDPGDMVKIMEGKQGCKLKLAEKSSRISTFIY